MQGVAAASKSIFSRHLDMKFDLSDNAYKPIENIGTGAYGVVCSAIHKKSGDKVAIKKIPNAFQELTTAKRTYRELKILRHFNHDNIIGIREILNPRGGVSELKDVYVVMDLMESDLHQIIHSTQPFSLEHIRYFLYQILRGLKYIHSANVVHRDLKPSNLLVNENCELKIGDFGMARGISMNADSSKRKVFMTAYVATRWYRAPELLFSNDDYSMAVDMWSVGCIFAEMIGRKQIFPGKNPMHQLSLIVEALGMPPDRMLRSTNSDQIYNFFHKNFSNHKPVDFHVKYPGSNKKAIDLLSKMLVFTAADRISVKDALKHPFLSKYHDPDDEPECMPAFDFSFEQEDLKKEQIRQRVGKMILKYQRNVFGPAKVCHLAKSDSLASDTALQPSKAIVTHSSNQPHQQHPCRPVIKGNHSGTIFKVPTAPVPQSQTTTDLKGSIKAVHKESHNTMSGLLCVNTEQDITGNLSDVDMKSATSESQNVMPSSQNLIASSLHPARTSIVSAASDVDMRSAGSSASQNEPTQGKGASKTTTLNVSSSVLTPASDVEMKSAKGTPSSTSQISTITTSTHLGDINIGLTEDVAMHSARSPKIPSAAREEMTKTNDVKEVSQGANVFAGVVCGDSQGFKTISDDTKALIKAALLNSALKNKLKKDSTSADGSKGGGKMTVTAQSRQREREEKRRQKMKRSQERQKKMKSKCKNQENCVILTEHDKNMLKRWSEMQAGTSTKQSSLLKCRLKSESSESNANPNAPLKHVPTQGDVPVKDPNISLLKDSHTTNTTKTASTGLQMLANANMMQIGTMQNLGVAVSNIAQSNVSVAAAPNRSSSGNQRRLMPKNSNTCAGAMVTNTVAASTAATMPNTFTIMTQLAAGQNVVDPASSESTSAYTGNIAATGVPIANATSVNVQPQTQFVIPQNSVASIGGMHNPHHSTSDISSFQPINSISEGSTSVKPKTFAKAGNSPISDELSYRSRIYSDRETPSPPLAISPPTYEEAIKAKLKTNSRDSCEENDFLASLDNISPFKTSPSAKLGQASSLPFSKPSDPPDLASVIQQFSKSMVEDILPPVLALTPRGDGTGYGLSLDLEDLLGQSLDLPPISHPPPEANNKHQDSAPLSASLLSDWLEVRNLNVDDMQAVQQELGMTSPFNMTDLASLGNISPPTKS